MKVKRSVAVWLLVPALMTLSQTVFADGLPLYLYDNFDRTSPEYTDSAWTAEEANDGKVDISGPEAIMDMSYERPDANLLHCARIIANDINLVFNSAGDEFRITFDIERLEPDGWDGWVSGLSIGNEYEHNLYGGLWGQAQGIRDNGAGFNVYWFEKKYFPGPNVRYHVDLTVTVVWAFGGDCYIKALYAYWFHNPAYDQDPELYYNESMINGVSASATYTMPTGEELSVRFCSERPFSGDTGGHERMKIAVDNIYTSIDVGAPVADCTPSPQSDFNYDCRVDLYDFAIIAGNWLECNLDPSSACP